MPCKHENGADACERYVGGGCKASTRQRGLKWAQNNKERMQSLQTKARLANIKSSVLGRRRTGDIGYAGELIVRTDLLLRGLEVTVPENRACPDDVHFKSSQGWVSVQVKVVTVYKSTGNWSKPRRPASSDVLALVDIRARVIRYEANATPLPPELLGDE